MALSYDGTIHFIRGDCEAIFDDKNTFLDLVAGSGQDIAERKRAEEEIQRYSVELEKSNEEFQKALANVQQLSGMQPICASCRKNQERQRILE